MSPAAIIATKLMSSSCPPANAPPARALAAIFLFAATAAAAQWQFSPRLAVTAPPQSGIFHHLEGAGRKHIAISADTVAVVWEDNSAANPQVYLSLRHPNATAFTTPIAISDGNEAYEPAIAALSDTRFLIVYEQDRAIYARLWSPTALSPAHRLSATTATASHASIATAGRHAAAIWREQDQSHRQYHLKVATLHHHNHRITVQNTTTVEPTPLPTPILMPTIALHRATVGIAWEDRRAGHTRLLTAVSPWPPRQFSEPQYLNEFFSNRNPYDKGSGVTRVAIAAFGEDEILAAWMDKRRGGVGYGIFAALAAEGGTSFGPNEKVHGSHGDTQPHYNPATAGNANGDFIVAWDDFRNGDSDIWLSHYNDDDEWGADLTPAPATGSGEQSHPRHRLG